MGFLDKFMCRVIGATYDAILGGFPPTVRIETTNRCNARCTICPHSRMERESGTMDDELYRSLVDECAARGCNTLHLHNFGEPLLDPDLPERIAYAKGKGIGKVKIFTNGSLLSGSRAQALLESGLDEIKVSIDGADGEEFESIRLGLRYNRVVSNVDAFVRLRNEKNRTRPRVTVACCSTSNREQSQDRLGAVVDEYDFTRIHNWGDQDESGRRRIRKPCSRVWRTFTVLWNGDVALCCLDYDGKVILGNLTQDGSIAKVWKNSRYRDVRAHHRSAEQDRISICEHCSKSFF